MRHTLILLLSVALFSCQKEATINHTDMQRSIAPSSAVLQTVTYTSSGSAYTATTKTGSAYFTVLLDKDNKFISITKGPESSITVIGCINAKLIECGRDFGCAYHFAITPWDYMMTYAHQCGAF